MGDRVKCMLCNSEMIELYREDSSCILECLECRSLFLNSDYYYAIVTEEEVLLHISKQYRLGVCDSCKREEKVVFTIIRNKSRYLCRECLRRIPIRISIVELVYP